MFDGGICTIRHALSAKQTKRAIINMELDIDMSSLELNDKKRRFCATNGFDAEVEEVDDETAAEPKLRRSSRKKIRPLDLEKRRVYTKPRKYDTSSCDITNYCLNKKVKIAHTSLETIFEEPKSVKAGVSFMSGRKFKRAIDFNSPVTTDKLKTKKRHMKAKQLVSSKKILRRKKVTKELLLQQLKVAEEIHENTS